eukprot:CAMPEP_0204302456 /NCGR_PEP_ID=MMETSP0468-20130131/82158_1 /ASSEMBLY_ACC=CAM_ASM_000383 /TAXON_ID=2969 /ORGANISM="Oxyrrhis marina" /LENGTH=54 /DNA_ID=CAMNT_0051281681 /DNA_START=640 /DNA_END=804 /DNA_ORIENTATION=+
MDDRSRRKSLGCRVEHGLRSPHGYVVPHDALHPVASLRARRSDNTITQVPKDAR